MSDFSQYSGIAGSIADKAGISQPVFFGLIQQESSWNANAAAHGSSAYGFGQLLKGTAHDLGVNRFDPVQNLQGTADYFGGLMHKFGGNVTTALAAYHDGPGAVGQHGGFAYAKSVLSKAQGFLAKGSHLLGLDSGIGKAALNVIAPGSGDALAAVDNLGGGGCGINPICYLQQWITDSGFFKRLSLAMVAFIILAAAFYLMNKPVINSAIKTAVAA